MDALLPVITLLDQHLQDQAHCTEHELIKLVQHAELEPFCQFDLKQSKALFNAHFLLKHCLYRLQEQGMREREFVLEITSVSIKRLPYHSGAYALRPSDPLRAYYLNIDHYFETSEDDVNQLLGDFWQRYLLQNDAQAALKTLELSPEADYAAVKQSYRRLAQKSHPDKGGTPSEFVKINAAKEILDKHFFKKAKI